MAPGTAALVDGDPVRRSALRALLEATGVIVEPATGPGVALLSALRTARPQWVFLAFEEPLARAATTAEAIAQALPDTTIVAFGDDTSVPVYQRAIRAGAAYLIEPPQTPAEVQHVLDALQKRASPPLERPLEGTVVVVAGPKGGIGKTTISVNLASALAAENHGSVLLVDLDPDFGDAGIMLDINTNVSAARAARQQAHLEFESFRRSLATHRSGAFLLGAPQNFGERLQASPEEIRSLIGFAAQAFDFVVIDTACMLDDTVLTALEVADVTLLATTLEFASLRNAAVLLDDMAYEGAPRDRSLVVANHLDPVPNFSVGDAAEVLERESMWEVPFDRAVPRSTQRGEPIALTSPRSPASRSIRALAARLGEDPRNIDRRVVVRGESLAPPGVRERLLRVVQSARRTLEPVYSFSTSAKSAVFHVPGCNLERRIAAVSRASAPASAVPGHLRPCRVCLPRQGAAA